MSLQLLPIDLKIKLLELCPQLRFVLSEFRDLLKNFKKLEELDYPTDQNYFREKIIFKYNDMHLHFTAKFWDCILTMQEYTWSSDSIVFHPKLPYLTIGTRNNSAIMLKINEDKSIQHIGIFIAHTFSIICAEFHPYLPIMATGSSDKTAKLWYINEYKYLETQQSFMCYATLTGHEYPVYTVYFHQILPILATLCPGSRIKLWRIDIINPVCFATLDRETDTFNSFAFHPIKPFFITGKNDVKLWKINENWSECQNDNSSEEVSYESSSESSSESFSERSSENSYESFYDNSPEIPQISYITHLGTYEENKNIQSIVIHPNLPIFATIRIDCSITLRKINNEENICEHIDTVLSQRTYSNSVTFHPNLPIVAVDSVDNTVKVYRLDKGVECIGTLEGHEEDILSITYHQTLPIMATGSKDCTIKIWLVKEDGSVIRCMSTMKIKKSLFTHPYYIKFHPILPILVGVTSDRSVKIWK